MKRKAFLLISLTTIILLSACLLPSCGHAPKRNFSDQDLLINVSVLPEHWALLDIYTMDNEEGEESGKTIIFYKTDTPYLVRAGEDVFHYSSAHRASWHYRRLEKYYFTPNIRETPPVVPKGFDFVSTAADQWRFGCMDTTFSPTPAFGKRSTICQYIAQYDEFLIYASITTQVDGQAMVSMKEVQRFIEAIDRKMARYLAP